jgi:hypothetical protein
MLPQDAEAALAFVGVVGVVVVVLDAVELLLELSFEVEELGVASAFFVSEPASSFFPGLEEL